MGTKILARDFDHFINTGTIDTPVWVEIKGINTWNLAPTLNRADTTTNDEDGVESHLPASRGMGFTISGKTTYTDPERTTLDPGQAAVLALAQEIGPVGLKQFKVVYPDDAASTDIFLASASVTPGGGGTNDASNFNVDLMRSGPTTSSVSGAAPATPGTPSGTPGDDLAILTWTGSAGTGGHFIVRAYLAGVLDKERIVSTSPYTFNGLASATTYTFTAQAVSATGVASAESTASAGVLTT